MSNHKFAEQIKYAFFEGYASYSTPCAPFNSVEEAWEESEAKDVYDKYIGKLNES